MECLGGTGYVEDSGLPRLYREAPVNAIWEGAGNVNALDVLRAIGREPAALEAVMDEIAAAHGADPRLDAAAAALKDALRQGDEVEGQARRTVEDLAVLLQASLLVRHLPGPVADAFVESRLPGTMRGCYGALPAGLDLDPIIERARVVA